MPTHTESALPEIQPTLAVDDPGAMDRFNQLLIAQFRANAGKLTGQLAGAPVLLLNTVGAKSGQVRTTPLGYVQDGAQYTIMASKSGSPTNPAWYHNLLAHPVANIEVGTQQLAVRYRLLEGEERARLWQRMVAHWPMAADYQRATSRQIPLIALFPGGN